MTHLGTGYGSAFLAVVAIGLSCGTTCGPLIHFFLGAYVLGHDSNAKQGVKSFGYFFLGKTIVLILMALCSSWIGSAWLKPEMRIFGCKPQLALDLFAIAIGIFLILRTFWLRRNNNPCKHCKKNGTFHESPFLDSQPWLLFSYGAAYAITPCAPTLFLLGLAAANTQFYGMILAICFSLASSVSPLVIGAAGVGFISQKIRKEIPQWIIFFQYQSFALLSITGVLSLLGHWK